MPRPCAAAADAHPHPIMRAWGSVVMPEYTLKLTAPTLDHLDRTHQAAAAAGGGAGGGGGGSSSIPSTMATARQERIRRGFVLISFKKGSGALYLDHTDSVIDTGKDFLREKEETGDPWAQIALRFHLGVRRMWRYINLAKHKNLQVRFPFLFVSI